MNMNKELSFGSDDPEVMFRFENPETGQQVAVIAAPPETMDEDGPVVIQLTEDNVVVLFNECFVEEKLERAIERNAEEFGESMAMEMAMASLLEMALLAASRKFEESWSMGFGIRRQPSIRLLRPTPLLVPDARADFPQYLSP